MSTGSVYPHQIFRALLLRPSRGLDLARRAALRPRRMVGFLAVVGLVRGLLDIPWVYWQAGKLPLLLPAVREPLWYAVNIGPFLVMAIVTALLRWVLFATMVHGLCRFVGGQGSYRASLGFYGPLLGITVVTILLDYLYFFLPLPLIRFHVSPLYDPIIGVGQVATAVWIGWMSYRFIRQEYRLAPWPAAMAGAFVPLINTGLFLIVLRLVLPLVPAETSLRDLTLGLNAAFVVFELLAFVGLYLWATGRLAAGSGRRRTSDRRETTRGRKSSLVLGALRNPLSPVPDHGAASAARR